MLCMVRKCFFFFICEIVFDACWPYNLCIIAGDHSKLELCYEYKLSRFAFSFCKGNFGSVKTKEFFCVVHMDNSLTFFEQDSIAYECTLPGERNIPSVFIYVPRIDSFVTVSAAYDVECFR